jgi:uncharacterized protein with HEPN domain
MSERKRDYILFLEDILNAIERIERYTKGLTFEGLSKNDMATDAILRNFEIIGEAAKNIPERVRRKYPFVEWKEAIGFGNVLIHDYFGIDLEAVLGYGQEKYTFPKEQHHESIARRTAGCEIVVTACE